MPDLLPYQHIGAQFLAERPAAMLLDAMRVGKTPQAIRACDLTGARTIVWQTKGRARWDHAAQWQTFSPGRDVVVLTSGKDRPKADAVNITSYELASGALFDALIDICPDTVIFDEFHQFGNRDTRRTKAAYGAKINGRGGLIQWPFRVWFLSGTPAPRDPSQIWPTLRCAFPDTIAMTNGKPMDYWSFVNNYCVVEETGFGKKIIGGKNLNRLREKIAPYTLRRTFEEVNSETPKLRFADMPIDAAAYLKALRKSEIDAVLAEIGVTPDTPPETRVKAVERAQESVQRRLSQLTGLAKVGEVAATLIEELNEGMEKVVVFAWHRAVIEAYREALAEFNPVVMYGGSAPGADQKFNTDKTCRVFLGQIQAAGEAISLASADDIVFAEAFWTAGLVQQAYYRCSAPTKRRQVTVRFALANAGVDGDMMRAMRTRAEMMEDLFG